MRKYLGVFLALVTANVALAATIPSNTIRFGDGASSDKSIIFNKGSGASNPKLKWNNTSGALQFANDGTNFSDLGSGSGSGGGFNALTLNPEFETGIAQGWTSSGGTFAAVSSGSNLLYGKGSATFDASATGQYVQSDLYLIPVGLRGGDCLARIHYLGGDTSLKMRVLDGDGDLIVERTFQAAATQRQVFTQNFICPSSGTTNDLSFRLRVESTGNAAIVALDRMHLGEADNLSQVSQATLVGTLKYSSAASCGWTTVSSSYGDFSADTDCGTPAVTGNVSAPATKVPHVVLNTPGPGKYLVTAVFQFDNGTNAANACRLVDDLGTVLDGGAEVGILLGANSSATAIRTPTSLSGVVSYTTAQSNRTIKVQCRAASGTAEIDLGTTNYSMSFNVAKFPTDTEQAFRPDQVAWKVDVRVGGSNPSLGSSEVNDAGLSMALGTGSIAAGIPCNGTNPSVVGNLTCSAGSEVVGATFNLPVAGDVEACWGANYYNNTGTGVITAFQLAETGNANATVVQRPSAVDTVGHGTATMGEFNVFPIGHCATFTFTSSGQKTLKLFATTSTGTLLLDGGTGADSNRKFWMTIRPATQQTPAPLLVNSVISSNSGISVVEAGEWDSGSDNANCTTGTCRTRGQLGSAVSSVTFSATGEVNVNFAAGTFSEVPFCTCGVRNAGIATVGQCRMDRVASTTTVVKLQSTNDANTSLNSHGTFICVGKR